MLVCLPRRFNAVIIRPSPGLPVFLRPHVPSPTVVRDLDRHHPGDASLLLRRDPGDPTRPESHSHPFDANPHSGKLPAHANAIHPADRAIYGHSVTYDFLHTIRPGLTYSELHTGSDIDTDHNADGDADDHPHQHGHSNTLSDQHPSTHPDAGPAHRNADDPGGDDGTGHAAGSPDTRSEGNVTAMFAGSGAFDDG